jgi:hypothetical protein
MLRRRTPNSKQAPEPSSESSNPESLLLLDEDDQEQLLQSLEQEVAKQARQFQKLFALVGGFAFLVSLFYPFLCATECSSKWIIICWTHAVYSATMHGIVILISRDLRQQSRQAIYCLSILIIIPIILWILGKFADDIEHFHLGLMIGNIVTFVGWLLLRWDARSSGKALDDLNSAKYEHKSL